MGLGPDHSQSQAKFRDFALPEFQQWYTLEMIGARPREHKPVSWDLATQRGIQHTEIKATRLTNGTTKAYSEEHYKPLYRHSRVGVQETIISHARYNAARAGSRWFVAQPSVRTKPVVVLPHKATELFANYAWCG